MAVTVRIGAFVLYFDLHFLPLLRHAAHTRNVAKTPCETFGEDDDDPARRGRDEPPIFVELCKIVIYFAGLFFSCHTRKSVAIYIPPGIFFCNQRYYLKYGLRTDPKSKPLGQSLSHISKRAKGMLCWQCHRRYGRSHHMRLGVKPREFHVQRLNLSHEYFICSPLPFSSALFFDRTIISMTCISA